ncbi:MAG: pyridoxal 5'-phosphate synthase glutaminase subunit PdxT [Desulfobacterales bacterium]
MCVGLLGLQGAFRDHIPVLKTLKAEFRIVKEADDLSKVDRLILPGGESTVMAKFLNEFAMTKPLRDKIRKGMPVWGICAGCVLLADRAEGHAGLLQVLPAEIQRNAYGRQLASDMKMINIPAFRYSDFPAIFIRAPRFLSLGSGVEVLARCEKDPVFVRSGNIMATTFHPELSGNPIFHEYFLALQQKI